MIRLVLFILVIYLVYAFYKTTQNNKKEIKVKNPVRTKGVLKTSCPTPKAFLDYIEGKIDGKQKEAIRKHIDSCEDCMSALQALFDISAKEELKK